ncbi:MAG: FAD-binding oxidoreductase [Saprospiraceae bacterium]|nr:FAD-binding oxidoreductase [Saprospiraceae bacterium]
MKEYVALRVREVHRLTDTSVTIAFDVPAEHRAAFAFQAGQFLNVRTQIDGEEVRRSYSICASPSENMLRIAVKQVPDGKFSTYANQVLQAGDTVEVMPPQGKFTIMCEDGHTHQYVFFAAGSGITPVIALMRYILETESRSQVILFYGNQALDTIMFREELEAMKNTFLGRLSIHHVLSRERQSSDLFNGRIDADKCDAYSRVFFSVPDVRKFMICGPEGMIRALRDWLGQQGVERERIGFELFTTGVERRSRPQKKHLDIDPAAESLVTVRIDGAAMDFSLAYGGKSILDAAVANGADAPFSCKGGVCCTCKAKLVEGEVDMDMVYGLEPDEIEDGFILTCQAHPRTERLFVDFDMR